MKQRVLPIDPNTKKPFKDLAELRTWLVLERFITTGLRSVVQSSSNKRKQVA